MFRRRPDKQASMKQIIEALIVLLDKKKLIRRDEIQLQILENAGDVKTIKVGDREYKIDKEDE